MFIEDENDNSLLPGDDDDQFEEQASAEMKIAEIQTELNEMEAGTEEVDTKEATESGK